MFFTLSKIKYASNFFEWFFEFQKYFHQKLFSIVPFSVGDIFYILLIVSFGYFLFKISYKNSRRKFLLRGLIALNILYLMYQVSWGMLYFQQSILDKLPEKDITVEEVKRLTLVYLEKCKKTRTLVNEDDRGVFIITDLPSIKAEVLSNQVKIPSYWNNKKGTGVSALKPSLFEPVMSYTGILGYYNPFTAEAQYNATLPSTYVPFTLAHESAHQLGYAREQEANFIGFLIGEKARNTDLKYSTQYFVLKTLLHSLAENERVFVNEIIMQYSPEMKRDRLAEKLFVKKHEGLLDDFFGFTNDLFLKSNQQEGSITYSYFIDFLIRYQP